MQFRATVPESRISEMNAAAVRGDGAYVLYWMIAFRRLGWNFALDRAVEWARELKRPLIILEALDCDYRWASDRTHSFVIEGMAQKTDAILPAGVFYYPYLERAKGQGRGLVEAFAEMACVVVTDEYPCFFLPRIVKSTAAKLGVKLEQVDSNGLLPLRVAARAFPTAHAFRRWLQKTLPHHLSERPRANPLAGLSLPSAAPPFGKIGERWPSVTGGELPSAEALASLPIDHGIGPGAVDGGEQSARAALGAFLSRKLGDYGDSHSDPDSDERSGLSPYLHFGHISSHEIFAQLADSEKWSEAKIAVRATGERQGWWGMSKPAEAFLDQLITWRELGYNFCHYRTDYDQYESLPVWAKQTFRKHAGDEREYIYSLEQFARARTHDPLWNAAQRQLLREGRLHNYLRMLWGKKILEWTPSPEHALAIMIELNNRYAVDGRDPNSYSGIFWCLGRYDRPWGPERAVFGTVRFMSSQNTARKLNVKSYLQKYAATDGQAGAGLSI